MILSRYLVRVPLAFITAVGISWLAYKLRSLSASGAWAAVFLGTLVMGFGFDLGGPATLLGFFISASLLSKITARYKPRAGSLTKKGSNRDLWQVLANGGVAAAGFFLAAWLNHPGLALAAAGSLAAANADTWATELGAFSAKPPRLITNGRQVAPGTSGAVSALGFVGAGLGAALIALLYLLFSRVQENTGAVFICVTLSGLAASLLDSLLGATVQGVYYCPQCQKETEQEPLHYCGQVTQHLRGYVWMNNDTVNFFCTLTGALLTYFLHLVF